MLFLCKFTDCALNLEITEDNLNIVECFSTDNNTCNLNDSCKLKPIINDALSSFITEFYK